MNEEAYTLFDMEACRKYCPLFREHKGARLLWRDDSQTDSTEDLWLVSGSGQPIHECGRVKIPGNSLFEMMYVTYDDLKGCVGKAEVMIYDANR